VVVSDVVGPAPFRIGHKASGEGYLRVYSAREEIREGVGDGANPSYYQHTDYEVRNDQGKLLRHVGNFDGEYDSSPARIALPPGHYIVAASGKDYLEAQVPVLIEPGVTTNVHLDDRWHPPSTAGRNELVHEPNGNPVGWRAQSGG
jgi:hypothetical protein